MKKNKGKILLIIGILITTLIVIFILDYTMSIMNCKNPMSTIFRSIIQIIRYLVPLIISTIVIVGSNAKIIKKIIKYIITYIIIYLIIAIFMVILAIFIGDICWWTTWKPILYLYPEKDIDVNVKIEHPEYLLTTYPKYNDGWNIHVLKDGSIHDKDNKYYYALYWDESLTHKVDFKEGFYVTKENAIKFLEEKLSIIGLNPKERNEFIMYWLPKLEDNKKSIVYFELTKEAESYNKLIIKPKPDSLLRVRIHIKKVNKKINIKEQKLKPFKRTGFTAIEWGGTIYE